MEKVKAFFSGTWAKVVAVMAAIIGFLVYWINLKNKQANSLKAKIAIAGTQKEADMIEVEINQLKEKDKILKKELDDLDKVEVTLLEKRKEIDLREGKRTPDEIEEYWNK